MLPIVRLFSWEESVNVHLRRAYMKRFCSVSKTRRVRLIHLAQTRADYRKIWDHPGIVVLLGRTSLTSPQLPHAFQRFCCSSIVMMQPPTMATETTRSFQPETRALPAQFGKGGRLDQFLLGCPSPSASPARFHIWYNTSAGIRLLHPGKGEHTILMHPHESIDWYPIVKRYTTRLVHIRSVSPGKGEIQVAREVLHLLQEDGLESSYTAIGLDPLIANLPIKRCSQQRGQLTLYRPLPWVSGYNRKTDGRYKRKRSTHEPAVL